MELRPRDPDGVRKHVAHACFSQESGTLHTIHHRDQLVIRQIQNDIVMTKENDDRRAAQQV